jgi:hypothetical protein
MAQSIHKVAGLFARYSFVVLLCILAFPRPWLPPGLEMWMVITRLLIASMLISYFLGFTAGVVSCGVFSLVVLYYVIPPDDSFQIHTINGALEFGGFIIAGVGLSFVGWFASYVIPLLSSENTLRAGNRHMQSNR